jgi:hypothetical protein
MGTIPNPRSIQMQASIDPKEIAAAKKIYDRAYSFFKQAADEVKEHGQFVLENTDRYQCYVSTYRHNIGKMTPGAADAKSAPQTDAST